MSIIISDFSKGWQNQATQEDMVENGLFKVVDMDFDVAGALTCRGLNILHDPLSGLDEVDPIENMYGISVEGEDVRRIYLTIGSNLYRWLSTTKIMASLVADVGTRRLTYGSIKPTLADTTHTYICNGQTMICDDGTTDKTWGIDPPNNLLTPRIAGFTGNLSAGDYKYVYTFYDTYTGAESNPSNECGPLTVADNESVEIIGLRTSSNSRVNARRLYRTVANGGNYYLVATITDNVTSTYIDFAADTNLTLQAEFDQGVPPVAKIVYAYGDYLMLAEDVNFPNRIWFSRAGRPDNWPSSYYVNVGGAENQLKSLSQFEEKMYAVTTKSVAGMYVQGQTPDTFVAHDTRAHSGTKAGGSVVVGPQGIYYYSTYKDGIYLYDGGQSKRMSDAVRRLFGHTSGTWYDVVDRDTVNTVARGAFLGGKLYYSLPIKQSTGEIKNQIVVYDTTNEVWTLYDIECTDIFADQETGLLWGAKLVHGSTTNYTVYSLCAGGRSSVDSPQPEFVTKAYNFTDASRHPRGDREVNVGSKKRGGQDIEWLDRFRFDGLGSWTFEFYVDDVLRHSVSVSLSKSNCNTWYRFPSSLKGRTVYVRGVASGSPTPSTCMIREIEIA